MKKSAKVSLEEILVQEDYPELARYFEKRDPILRERTTETNKP